MTEQPGQHREPDPDDANDAQLPGPEDGPTKVPAYDPLTDDRGGIEFEVPAGVRDGDGGE